MDSNHIKMEMEAESGGVHIYHPSIREEGFEFFISSRFLQQILQACKCNNLKLDFKTISFKLI